MITKHITSIRSKQIPVAFRGLLRHVRVSTVQNGEIESKDDATHLHEAVETKIIEQDEPSYWNSGLKLNLVEEVDVCKCGAWYNDVIGVWE